MLGGTQAHPVPPIVAAALCMKPRGLLTAAQAEKVELLKHTSPGFSAMRGLAMRFRGLIGAPIPSCWIVGWTMPLAWEYMRCVNSQRPFAGAFLPSVTLSWKFGATAKPKGRSTDSGRRRIVPRDSLHLQAEEVFADPVWRTILSHSHSVRAADNTADPSRGLAGYITTYQDVAAASDLHLREMRRYRTLLVVDEVHHLPALADTDPDTAAHAAATDEEQASAWSQAILPLLECAAVPWAGQQSISQRSQLKWQHEPQNGEVITQDPWMLEKDYLNARVGVYYVPRDDDRPDYQ